MRGELRLAPHANAFGARNLSAFVSTLDDPKPSTPSQHFCSTIFHKTLLVKTPSDEPPTLGEALVEAFGAVVAFGALVYIAALVFGERALIHH
jgi:hypothetical protein